MRKGCTIAVPAIVAVALLLATASGAADPETNAGVKLAAAMNSPRAATRTPATAQQAFIDQYCSSCHNSEDWAGSLDLGMYSTVKMGPDAQTWEKVSRKVRGGMMPPADSKRPPAAQATLFAASIEQSLDQYDKSHFRLAPSTMARLNRTEFANAIRDILDIEIDAASLLPPDDSGPASTTCPACWWCHRP